ncbi:thiamine diphosphokinase [Clostridium baratii]|uniref:thiamine diphosphokinase n=1 Tax=Clostridium baratii TaxID=1561 RepID=UPI0009A35382|nr:thiamine diphosphokinase [Clostridium baratii]OPF51759.1 thiamine pyrophosphokinase [Clostridium baratii]OPF53404.1 thiamine diphosphokinase [Clostridium baratii]OPF57451.1 thiamine diphosphokinase [Clostridium baratii]OPF60451.1 thiamine diphosphokinase [Clostridium baratii]
MRSIIVSGGKAPSKELLKEYIKDDDYIVGVDKGCNILKEIEVTPNIILGDFDSIDKEVLNYYKDKNVKIEKFNAEKDYTDTDLGYIKALEVNPSEIILFGATGSRIDHMLGNIGILLKGLRENIKVTIVDDNNKMYAVNKSSLVKKEEGRVISFHALSDIVKNLTIKNGKYPLNNYNMTLLEPRAICNEFLDDDIYIEFDSGIILILYTKD